MIVRLVKTGNFGVFARLSRYFLDATGGAEGGRLDDSRRGGGETVSASIPEGKRALEICG